jgi:hypothetical protein
VSLPPAPAPRPDWARLRELFDAALPLPPAEREALLADPALPPALVAELRSLLAHAAEVSEADAEGGAFLDHTAAPTLPTRATTAGLQLGAWRLLAPLGAGGMGEVWRAARNDGRFEGAAAVKLLKRGMDSAAVLARFAQEQQALARLNHPHIARLLDAGLSPDGRPFFVMELVEGQPIDRATASLPLEARLRLFLQLADAVAHAHRNLLVHRDLKPSNVMVDQDGQVKLLDFGIAKALDPLEHRLGPDGDAEGATTVGGVRPYTPHYASPEQVRGEPVTTATDIYSLGVLLYQLLTGTRPTGRKATSAAEAARSVLDEQPTRPSRLSSEDVPDPQWVQTRRRLEGDLDNILLKTLGKQPAERYASVDALAADVLAYLDGRPVSARAASPAYVLGKWLRRHRAAAAAGALGGLGLLTGLLATLLQGRVALALGATGLGAGLVLALVQAQRAQRALEEAARSRDSATRHLGELRRLANSMVFEVNEALERGQIEGRKALVSAAAQSLERQTAFGQMSDAERVELGMALARLARLEGHENTNNVGNVAGALVLYDRALKVLEPLAPRLQAHAGWHAAMGATLEGRFAVTRQLRRPAEAMAAIERAAGHATQAVALAPEDLRLRCHECTLLAHRADQAYPVVRFHGLADLALARRHVEAAVRRSEELVAWAPTQPQALRVRGFVMRLAAGHVAISGQLQAALAAERDAFAFLERAIGMPGGEPLRASDYAQAAIRMAITSRAAGLYDEGAAVLAPALLQAQHDLHDNPGDEHRQRQLVAVSQTLLDLCLHRGREAEAEALYTQAHQHLPVLTPAHEADPLCKRPWQHAWMDSLQALAWARCGQLAPAQQRLQRLHGWMHGGTLRLRDDPAALDCELEANIHIASAQLATAMGLPDEAAASAEAALERLHAMRAVRDPSDAIEAVRSWQLAVRLAVSCTGEATAALQARLVEVVRAQQAELAARGLVDPATRAESRWLAAQAAG